MNLDLGSFAFGTYLNVGTGTPSWGTALGQSKPAYKFTYPGAEVILIGMVYCSVPLDRVSLPLGKGGRIYQASELDECQIASLFRKVFINGTRIDYPFIMVLVKEDSESHSGRKSIKYSDKNAYQYNGEQFSNSEFIRHARKVLGLNEQACWFVYSIEVYNQDELHLSAVIVDENHSIRYANSSERRDAWLELIPDTSIKSDYKGGLNITNSEIQQTASYFRPYITAIKSKPFLLLAGISGTGKSRIVRELARACWDEGTEEYKAQKPRNFEMVQVKPNWHDSSELIGYVSRVSGEPVFVAGNFLKFIAKAWEEQDVPYFLCLDEMNLAPVEQYFAEYLSVIESRKADEKGNITTDPILKKSPEDWYRILTSELTDDEDIRHQFLEDGICIPQNLIVVGTVNMDETTFSFSRKVLDRAMTIEMNEVNLSGGLENKYERIGKLGAAELIGNAVEGVDIYSSYKEVCDTAIDYLQKINDKLEGTPFKIAYRTRNEVLLYVVNNLPYKQIEGDEDSEYKDEFVIARALDEITNMKVLSRIEGDETKVSMKFLEGLGDTIEEALKDVFAEIFDEDEDEEPYKSISLAKLDEMKKRLSSGYTSFWS
ncbi:AAA domain (dynein-related subfamily) [Prevotella sp. tc2-28]|uniref:McrB family protein n=1 Tax=Prevotella sp. tc2-28 TaxID=1761888 RepID=UPI0008943713|nr:AAA family ATPase [Prevotella sp. tc2-28]SDZ93266.1 AAA domain (dynein-related subfamily) [Prevotella sp. tc2-28]